MSDITAPLTMPLSPPAQIPPIPAATAARTMTPTDCPIAVVSRSTSSNAFGSSFIAPTTRSPKVITPSIAAAPPGGHSVAHCRAQRPAVPDRSVTESLRSGLISPLPIHCRDGAWPPESACDNHRICLAHKSRNPGDIRPSRAPARSTARTPARSRSPSRRGASSRSTAATRTRARAATSAGRSGASRSASTARTASSTRPSARGERATASSRASAGTRHSTTSPSG